VKCKGTPNSVNDWIQVPAVWGPHVRLDERNVLTPQVRSWQCVYLQQMVYQRRRFTTINELKQAIITANCRSVSLIAPLVIGVAKQQGGHIEHVKTAGCDRYFIQ